MTELLNLISTSPSSESQSYTSYFTAGVVMLAGYILSDTSEEPAKKEASCEDFADWEVVTPESIPALAVFFDNTDSIDSKDINHLVNHINQNFPEYSIDPNQDLIPQICAAKDKMIAAGETNFLKQLENMSNRMGIYNYYLPFAASKGIRETIGKIYRYTQDRSLMTPDISYQRGMMLHYKAFRLG